MKNHKQVRTEPLYFNQPLEDVISMLRQRAEGMAEPRIVTESYGYDGGDESYIEGWVPMTDAEKEKEKQERKKKREAKKRQQEERDALERALLKKLATKHNVKLVEKE